MYTKWYKDIDPVQRAQLDGKYTYHVPDLQAKIAVNGTHYRSVQNGWHCPEHEHILYEINYVTEGSQRFTVAGKDYEQHPGDLMLIQPGSIHSSKATMGIGFSYFCIHFYIDDKAFLPYLNNANNLLFRANSTVTRRVSPVLYHIIELIKRTSTTIVDQIYLQTKLFELIGALIIALRDETEKSSNTSERKRKHALHIAEKIDLMIQHQTEKDNSHEFLRSIQDIAQELGISTSYCNRVFKQIYNISPQQYLSFKRLNDAKTLLLQSNLKVEQIAESLGYHDIAHFSKQFKRWTGMSPRQYAEQILDNPKT
jgi:AraC family transcriptional activator of pobA